MTRWLPPGGWHFANQDPQYVTTLDAELWLCHQDRPPFEVDDE